MKAVFDSDILIEFLNGNNHAKVELEKYEECLISIISWIEVLVGARSKSEEEIIKNFLKTFIVLDIDTNIAEIAVRLRKQHKIRLPDAIIWASATDSRCVLVTRNKKDFPKADPSIRIPF